MQLNYLKYCKTYKCSGTDENHITTVARRERQREGALSANVLSNSLMPCKTTPGGSSMQIVEFSRNVQVIHFATENGATTCPKWKTDKKFWESQYYDPSV